MNALVLAILSKTVLLKAMSEKKAVNRSKEIQLERYKSSNFNIYCPQLFSGVDAHIV